MGIESLPLSMDLALEEMKKDPFVKEVLGDHIFNKYVEAKESEWNRYRSFVTEWEVKEYLYKI